MNATTTPAMEIYNQIGSKAFYMMGAKNIVTNDGSSSENNPPCLMFQIRGSKKYNKIIIRLMPNDTYFIAFTKLTQGFTHLVRRDEIDNVYIENLHSVIESYTGLYLSL